MYRIILLFAALLTFELAAQEPEFLANDWQNPAVFEKGQNLPHAFHIPYENRDEAILNLPSKCTNYQLLNGYWSFKWVETPGQVPKDFWEADFDVKEWNKIMVPANWQMEGYGHAKFRNIALSFEGNAPNIPDYYNPVGCYKRKITIPKNWDDKAIMLRFEGVKSAAYIWVNGKRVGYNQGGFEPAEFNITEFVQEGENDLAVQVFRFCDGSYLENQDMWRLSGIFRDVKLYAQPKTYIHDFYVMSDFDANYKDATLNVNIDIANLLKEETRGMVEFNVFNAEGRSVLQEGMQNLTFVADSGAVKTLEFSTPVIDVPQWSAEFPNLFILLVELKNAEGQTTECFTQKIGFREVEYRNKILSVNGVPVKLNGVNSHMHHPEHGQAVPVETLRQDLLLMKQHNINCVRTSHYPPNPEYLALADEIGMYIIDEVSDEAHSNTQLSGNKAWTAMYCDRSRKLVHRDRNHPSVIMWSAGNESGSGFNIRELIKTGKKIDSSRPAWMYGGNTFHIPFEDVVGPRYWLPVDYRNLALSKAQKSNDQRSSFMDEYLAATGNGLGGMDEYWEYVWRYPRLIGGAIWDWVSPGINTQRWILPDLSEAKNHGQIMGRPILAEGKHGWGLEFSGHDDWIEFYRHPSLDFEGNEFTISFWIKPAEIPQANVFIAKGKHAYGIQMPNSSTLEFYAFNGKRIAAKAKVDKDFYGKWHHIAGVCTGRQLQLYVDGKRVGATTFAGKINSAPFPLCVGRNAETQDQGEYSGRLSKMIMDELKMFNKAISVNNIDKTKDGLVLHLDFEKDEKGKDFYAVGLGGRTYGVVWPNRVVQPEIHQIKKTGQPLKIDVVDIDKGMFKVKNRHHFKNLIELGGVWHLHVDGEPTQRGFFEVNAKAGETEEFIIDYRKPRIDSNAECYLTISFVLRQDLLWAKRGHEVGWQQFEVPSDYYFVDKPKSTGTVKFEERADLLVVKGTDFKYSFNKSTGELSSLIKKGKEYLDGATQFNVWRAPLANDVDPWGSYMYSNNYRSEGKGRSIDNQLRTLGMRDLKSQLDEFEVKQIHGDKLSLNIRAFSCTSNPTSSNVSGKFSAFERRECWTITADGSIELEQEIIPHGPMPDLLPKIGLQFNIPKAFHKVEYFGRGPFENYPDRKTGAKLGRYVSTVDSMYVPYLMPQDYGNRCDVRWLKIENDEGQGVFIEASEVMNFSFHKYSTDNLSRAMHTYQLEPAKNNTLNIDYKVSGVGGTAIRQLQKYRVKPRVEKYSLKIVPF